MVLLEDYFYSHRRTKLTSFLSMADPYPAAARFRALLGLFLPATGGYLPAAEALREADRRRRLSLSGVRRGDRRDEDEPSGKTAGRAGGQGDLGLVLAVEREVPAFSPRVVFVDARNRIVRSSSPQGRLAKSSRKK